jgi:hypothetical protein
MHGDGLITLSSVRLAPGKELPGRFSHFYRFCNLRDYLYSPPSLTITALISAGGDKGTVWLWLRPLDSSGCPTFRFTLSAEATCMSFAHFLNLMFNARHLVTADRNLQARLGWVSLGRGLACCKSKERSTCKLTFSYTMRSSAGVCPLLGFSRHNILPPLLAHHPAPHPPSTSPDRTALQQRGHMVEAGDQRSYGAG